MGYDNGDLTMRECTMRTSDIKASLHQLADQLPEDATWDDVMEKLRFQQSVEKGLRAADRGAFATEADVKAAFKRWGVTIAH